MDPRTGEIHRVPSDEVARERGLVPLNPGQWVDTVIDGKNVTFEVVSISGNMVMIHFKPARVKP